jgi:hypothetical protein
VVALLAVALLAVALLAVALLAVAPLALALAALDGLAADSCCSRLSNTLSRLLFAVVAVLLELLKFEDELPLT